ncbi:MAG: heavy metal-binding domain-containing protein [Acidimicrobiia bacterium]
MQVARRPADPWGDPLPDERSRTEEPAAFTTATRSTVARSEWGAARAEQHEVAPPEPVATTVSPDVEHRTAPDRHVVFDLRHPAPDPHPPATRQPAASDYGLGQRWGSSWRDAAQGWVSGNDGRPVWRPVVSTTEHLASWDVDTYLGIVTAEVAVEAGGDSFRKLGDTLARGRAVGIDGLVEEAIERGAHGVIGVTMQYTPLGDRLLLTITGTAVTLRERR